MKHTKLALAIIITIFAMHSKAQNQKPNIILILADDLGNKSLNCNGGNLFSTPNIDKLAKQGMRFKQCHASPTCSPSRFLLLTGKYNFRNYTVWGQMDTSQRTIGNMFRDAGYNTAYFGKWQLNGGDESIRALGFDTYTVHCPFTSSDAGNRYKSPHLYTHGAFLADSLTKNKYCEDIFVDSIFSFIDNKKNSPFFIYYPMNVVHEPFTPTPDDEEFESWPDHKGSDTAFFPSMVNYMDKKIGEIITKLKLRGLDSRTLILFSGDNGTPFNVWEYVDENGNKVKGGKEQTTEAGIRVPLLAYWPGVVNKGSVNNDLIGFVDFLPTLADIASIPLPTNYGPLDGVSFAPRLKNNSGTPRKWLFNHYERSPEEYLKNTKFGCWAQTKAYKLYDTSALSKSRLFYNIIDDPKEQHPIPDSLLTAEEAAIKQKLLKVINSYIAQGTALLADPAISDATDSSALIANTILINGGSTVTSSGVVWSKSPKPTISSSHTNDNICIGSFSSAIKGLIANTTYYIRTYATNFAGTAYSNQISFRTPLKVPVATKATEIDSIKFTSNWKAYTGATNYRLDVSTSSTFTKIISSTIKEGFDNGIIIPVGWTITDNIVADTSSFGKASPSLLFLKPKTQLMTNQLTGSATQLKFWMRGLNMDDTSFLLVEGFDGNTWDTIATLAKPPKAGTTKIYNANSNPPLKPGFIQFRFTYIKKIGKLFLDDVSIKYKKPVPSFIPGYNDLLVKTNSRLVTGLKPATNYYYRVRAKTEDGSTGNSKVIIVTTKRVTSVTDTANYQPGIQIDSSAASIAKKEDFNIQVLPNPSPREFILTLQNSKNEKLTIVVMDISGKILYKTATRSDGKYVFGKTFAPGAYFVNVNAGTLNKTIKVIKGN